MIIVELFIVVVIMEFAGLAEKADQIASAKYPSHRSNYANANL
jgi:hypothetical protein